MVDLTTTPLTPRRSKRGQPLVFTQASRSSFAFHSNATSTDRWTREEEPLVVRETKEEDLIDVDELELGVDGDGEEVEDDERDRRKNERKKVEYETKFYDRFTRHIRSKPPPKSKSRNIQANIQLRTVDFKVGDPVLVVTDLRKTSVAVITSMWEVMGGEPPDPSSTDEEEDEDGAGEEKKRRMRVRVHWFVKPSQLPSVRVKREHYENEIYYSLCSTTVLPTSAILSHCEITTLPPSTPFTKTAARTGSTPSKKRPAEEDSKSIQPVTKRRRTTSNTNNNMNSDELEKFYCRLVVNNQKGLFYVFDWNQHREAALQSRPSRADPAFGSGKEWEAQVRDLAVAGAKKGDGTGSKKLKSIKEEGDDLHEEGEGSESEEDDSADEYTQQDKNEEEDDLSDQSADVTEEDAELEDADSEEDAVPKTPTKKRKRTANKNATAASRPRSPHKPSSAASTPRKPRKRPIAEPTPHSKAAIRNRARSRKTRPLPGLSLDLLLAGEGGGNKIKLPDNPWLRAMHVLHVASRPEALPCRDEEYGKVMRAVEQLIEEGSGGCVYISGVPGTGKTATVHAVVRELKRMAENNETNPFTYVEINGLRIPEPSAAYSLLWEAVSGHDVAEEGHLKISAKEALKNLTRHFGSSGRRGPGGHACVVLMDELDQLMTTKQDVVYNFFNWPTLVGSKLVVLAVANTMDLPERVMSGRVRSRLGMIRINFQPYNTQQLMEIVSSRIATSREGLKADAPQVIAPDSLKLAAMKVASISGDARRVLDICRRTVELVMPLKRAAKAADVNEVIRFMQNSPTAAYLRDCSFHERLVLASLLKCVKKEGVEEIKWGDIQRQHWLYIGVLAGDADSERKPTPRELGYVLDSLLASRALLMEEGAAAAKKSIDERKVILNLEQGEVERVLSEVGGQRWKNALNVS